MGCLVQHGERTGKLGRGRASASLPTGARKTERYCKGVIHSSALDETKQTKETSPIAFGGLGGVRQTTSCCALTAPCAAPLARHFSSVRRPRPWETHIWELDKGNRRMAATKRSAGGSESCHLLLVEFSVR